MFNIILIYRPVKLKNFHRIPVIVDPEFHNPIGITKQNIIRERQIQQDL